MLKINVKQELEPFLKIFTVRGRSIVAIGIFR